MLEKDYIQPVTHQSPNPACRQSEGGKERQGDLVILFPFSPSFAFFILRLQHAETSKTITRPPQPPTSRLCCTSGCASYITFYKKAKTENPSLLKLTFIIAAVQLCIATYDKRHIQLSGQMFTVVH